MALKKKVFTTLSLLSSAVLLFNQIPSAVGHSEHDDGLDLDCSSYTNTITLREGKIEYVSTDTTISIRMSSTRNDGYLSIGFSDSGMMNGSEVAVGNDEGVSLYSLIGHDARKIVDDTRQAALLDASFVQDDSGSVLEFSKLLNDGTDNRVIDGNGKNIFIWAIGNTNDIFAGHGWNRGSVPITLTPCAEGGKGTELTYKERNSKDLFLLHGIFAIIAFAVCMPIAIAAVTARNLFMKDGLWFKIHFYTMGLACVICIVVFGLSVYAVNNKGSVHFHNAHGIIGLITTILVTIQVVSAMLRPSASHPSQSSADDTDYDSTAEAGTMPIEKKVKNEKFEEEEEEEEEEEVEVEVEVEAEATKKRYLRTVWEKLHRFLALLILIGGYYQIHSGIVIYSDIYNTKNYVGIFWIVVGVLFSILAGVVFYSKTVILKG